MAADVIVFYYTAGNEVAKDRAEANAKRIKSRPAEARPWSEDMGPFKPVEQVAAGRLSSLSRADEVL
jgi:hypothetical protein